MKTKITLLTIGIYLLLSCSVAGPRVTYVLKDGKWCRKMVTFNYPNGVKTKMDESIYNNGWLVKEKIYTVRWPNGEYHLISKKGFVSFDNDTYTYYVDSIRKPDNLIFEYFLADNTPMVDVYKDGVRVPYLLGYEDGHQTMDYLRDPPGVYNWKDGVEYYERPFTDEEWQSHLRMNEYLNSDEYKKNLPDHLKSDSI